MTTLLLSLADWDPRRWLENLKTALPEDDVVATTPEGGFAGDPATLERVEYLITWKPRPDLFDSLPNLKAILSVGAGVDHLVDLPNLPNVPIARIVDPDLTTRMTEYVVWQALHHVRLGPDYAALQKEKRWRPLYQPPAGKVTVGIMGLGVLGTASAKMLMQLGFRVVGWSRRPKIVAGVTAFAGEGERDAFLAETDILVCLLPDTPQTRGILDGALISKLRTDGPLGGPVLINAGRGQSQNEADILSALRDGTLRGASLDVFRTEPLPADSPMWTAPNLVITPHMASISDPHGLSPLIARQVRRGKAGKPLQYVVDRDAGY
ncbi:glyoxylate/hydroxypyruvate reductase A [Rhodopseudomonas julia]|uniref:Glyoxylate/hydroxypyruvate reductase A n=1 Tax=Rhodopseudomonas julia TaxID=200617 RepID=A0ABU0C3U7_9BRAD|nr:glyoxylate/hydroxypyruvate reductase A [Rhodopseudomonas julia]MDQ0325174.1 glyoxylate/hydroxypyruvate reductase A [Rhodopseudomonas julia]